MARVVQKPEVELLPVTQEDLPLIVRLSSRFCSSRASRKGGVVKSQVPVESALTPSLSQAEGHLAAFPTFYAPLEPSSKLPSHEIRVQRFTIRLSKILSRPDTLWTKAVLASGPEKGKFVGLAVWHAPGAPVVNPKRRWIEGAAEESEEDRQAWDHVDMEAWEKVWTEWDAVRARIMDGKDHWCALRRPSSLPIRIHALSTRFTDLCPVWVVPGYQGLGIGRKLMQQVLDLCDAQQPPTPIYLEASKEGKPLYEKLGFEVVGTSDYVEMVRWGKRE